MTLKKIFRLILTVLALQGTYLFCHKQTAGFQIGKVISYLPYSTQWELPNEELTQEYFNQPFYYLDKGGQSYAFLSQDGKMVLKLFKMHNLRQYPYAYKIALPGILDGLRLRILCLQKEKLDRLFNSCKLAYTELKEETGLIYLNLNPHPDFKNKEVTLIDKLGIAHSISLEHIPFALQKKADRALSSLREDFKNKDYLSAKKKIKQIIDCLKERQEKKIVDIDPALKRNMGFCENRAILIDIGSFFPAKEPFSQETLFQETRRFHHWTEKHAPQLADYVDSLIIPSS